MHNIAEKTFSILLCAGFFCFDPFFIRKNIRHLSGTLMRLSNNFANQRLIYPAYLIYYTRQMNNYKVFSLGLDTHAAGDGTYS